MYIVDAVVAACVTVALLLACFWVISDWRKARDARRQGEEELEQYKNAFGRK